MAGLGTSSLASCLVFVLLLAHDVYPMAVTDIQLHTNNQKDDYVLHGEGAVLSCHYLLESESLTSVLWLRDDVEVYHWRNNLAPIAKESFEGRVDLNNKSPITINITKAHKDMSGTITCRVTASNKVAENNMFKLMVIVDACKETNFETYTDMIKCTESINMRCIGMYPKPSPQCAIVNELTQSYIRSVPLDTIKELKNGTFEVSLTRMFTIAEFINYTDISLSCNIVVTGTTWRKGIKHRLFGDRGCRSVPPSIENGYFNLTTGRTCWNDPQDGVEAQYYCDAGFELIGSETMLCRNGTWITQLSMGVSTMHTPICNSCLALRFSHSVIFISFLMTIMYSKPRI